MTEGSNNLQQLVLEQVHGIETTLVLSIDSQLTFSPKKLRRLI